MDAVVLPCAVLMKELLEAPTSKKMAKLALDVLHDILVGKTVAEFYVGHSTSTLLSRQQPSSQCTTILAAVHGCMATFPRSRGVQRRVLKVLAKISSFLHPLAAWCVGGELVGVARYS